ncbi:MAG: PIN domain-containing protein [Acidobacteriota bacterium]
MRAWLLDTGPLVAYLDATDSAHGSVTTRLGEWTGRLCTTSAVVTEAMHFVAASPRGPSLLAAFARESGLLVYECAQPWQIAEAAALMAQYADTPMDFADATLVLLAERLGVLDIATLDRRGFTAYRVARRRPFRLVLDRDAR